MLCTELYWWVYALCDPLQTPQSLAVWKEVSAGWQEQMVKPPVSFLAL